MNPQGPGAGSNPLMGGSGASQATNPQVGGLPDTQVTANPQAGGLPPTTPVPGQGTPADSKGANSQAEGRSESENADATREAEWKRENQKLRERLAAIEAETKAAQDAKLSKEELTARELAELQRRNADHEIERQRWYLERAVIDEANRLRLHDVQTAVMLLKSDYADLLDYDDTGKPTNVPKMLDRLLAKKPWLAAPEPTPQAPPPPNSGRIGTPRASTGQYQPPQEDVRPPKTVPLSEMPTLSEFQWSQPRGDLGNNGGNRE